MLNYVFSQYCTVRFKGCICLFQFNISKNHSDALIVFFHSLFNGILQPCFLDTVVLFLQGWVITFFRHTLDGSMYEWLIINGCNQMHSELVKTPFLLQNFPRIFLYWLRVCQRASNVPNIFLIPHHRFLLLISLSK